MINLKYFFTILLIASLVVFGFITSCSNEDTLEQPNGKELEEPLNPQEETKQEDKTAEEAIPDQNKLIYFEVGIDEDSLHFEHRVANVYCTDIQDPGKELVYSDIDDKYGLTDVYNISPDGEKILCRIADDAKGLYSALAFIDISTGGLKVIKEFDFPDEEGVTEGIYGDPVWAGDSNEVAFLNVSYPYSEDFSFKDIVIINISEGTENYLEIEDFDVDGMILQPVKFMSSGEGLIAVKKQIMQKTEDGMVLGSYPRYIGIESVDISSGKVDSILELSKIEGLESDAISSMGGYVFNQDASILFFDILLDFEDDGDIYALNLKDKNIDPVTVDSELREQQPAIYSPVDGNAKLAYVGVPRYGTIAYERKVGNIFLISDLEDGKASDLKIEGKHPVFSPDGNLIAFIYSEFDENYEYVKKYHVKIYDIDSGKTNTLISSEGLIFFIGWINNR